MAPKSTDRARFLIRLAAPQAELDTLEAVLRKVRGIHAVEVEHGSEWDNAINGRKATGWRYVRVRGTHNGVIGARNLVAFSGLEELDQNADHDHAACIESARKMGVPAAWAHTPETYLSM